jgi:hypothetical protein
MEFRIIPRPTPVHSREFRTVRIDGQSVQPRSPAAAHAPPGDSKGIGGGLQVRRPSPKSETTTEHASIVLGRRTKDVPIGRLTVRLGSSEVYVLPSTSGAASRYWTIEPWLELARSI